MTDRDRLYLPLVRELIVPPDDLEPHAVTNSDRAYLSGRKRATGRQTRMTPILLAEFLVSEARTISPTVAALYVEKRSIYKSMEGVECWDAERDARLYRGHHPVVAHPPCGPWGQLAHLCTKQDPALAPLGVAQVICYGGVMEHPANSKVYR